MLKKFLVKSVASATAAVGVVALAGLTPATVTSAPFVKVACEESYPNPIATNTDVRVAKPIQQYGQKNRAIVNVSSTSGTPTGRVRITVVRPGADFTDTVPLDDGRAVVALPRLDAGATYPVRARFLPNCNTGEYAPSGDSAFVTVKKADTEVRRVRARDIESGGRPRVVAIVASDTVSPGGDARVMISKGKREKSMVVDLEKLDDGRSRVVALFGKTFAEGNWDVVVKYLGTDNFQRSSGGTIFTITG